MTSHKFDMQVQKIVNFNKTEKLKLVCCVVHFNQLSDAAGSTRKLVEILFFSLSRHFIVFRQKINLYYKMQCNILTLAQLS